MSINLLISKRDELAKQLADHDAMLADARKQERAEAVEKLKALMAEHGITSDDLRAPVVLKVRHISASKPARKASTPGITYEFGNGKTYTTGKPGKPPAAYLAAKQSGLLSMYRVPAVAETA